MALLLTAYVSVRTRLADLTSPEKRDRGESPVSTVIIIAGLAALAVGVMIWAYAEVQAYMNRDLGTIPAVPN
ncbi:MULTISPECIES: hypothetical protein [Catenuloplanes]|uniref:Uncharacterized protein n=1 Tax=Catenuloplanes niger TaxID=587534 RepID=A0AAE3ZNN1_9ACTN|nr:hypothetical protein [Catenuloplanes niger]MDR7322232.1 hypothetical protein [Catenuloplanes niger]